jgi:DNA-binding IclR family transcriptional regulator
MLSSVMAQVLHVLARADSARTLSEIASELQVEAATANAAIDVLSSWSFVVEGGRGWELSPKLRRADRRAVMHRVAHFLAETPVADPFLPRPTYPALN